MGVLLETVIPGKKVGHFPGTDFRDFPGNGNHYFIYFVGPYHCSVEYGGFDYDFPYPEYLFRTWATFFAFAVSQ